VTRRHTTPASFTCPQCGAEVKVGAVVCRECGSDDRTGWQSSEEVDYQSLDLPDDEPPAAPTARAPGARAVVVITLVLVVLLLLWAVWR